MTDWTEVADGVWHARYQPIDISTVLVRGDGGLLLVDTRCNPREAAELAADVEALNMGPIRWIVNTHAHYDHFFGNAVFADAGVTEFWAHENCAAEIDENGDSQRRSVGAAEFFGMPLRRVVILSTVVEI